MKTGLHKLQLRSSVLLVAALIIFSSAAKTNTSELLILENSIFFKSNFICTYFNYSSNFKSQKRPNPLVQLFKAKQRKNKKITAAILAFPFPFGMVGLHRIYMGCAPYVPVVYIGTVGGAFGILPLIDFIMILSEKDLERFSNNERVFMWAK